MSDINWNEGAVCYTDAGQWVLSEVKKTLKRAKGERRVGFEQALNQHDFKLNEIRTGDYIPASELDTEQKYNEVVEVFGLFGFADQSAVGYDGSFDITFIDEYNLIDQGYIKHHSELCKRQLTYSQIIAIGKLKRMMLECERSKDGYFDVSRVYNAEDFPKLDLEEKPKRRNKSKQAYGILKSLDYEYDLVKQRWFKKQYID